MKKTVIAAAVGAVLGGPAVALAVPTEGPVVFINPANNVQTFLESMTLKAGSVLLEELIPAGGAISTSEATQSKFFFRYQTTISAMNALSGNPSVVTDSSKQEYELTVRAPMQAWLDTVSDSTKPTLNLSLDGTGVGSFTIRYDSPHPVGGPIGGATLGANTAINTTGQHFYDGTGVLEGNFLAGAGQIQNISVTSTTCGKTTGGTATLDKVASNQFGSAVTSCLSGNIDNPGFLINITSRNTAFFPDVGAAGTYVLQLSTAPQLLDPFAPPGSNPSAQFGRGTTVVGQPLHVVDLGEGVAAEGGLAGEATIENFPAGSTNNFVGGTNTQDLLLSVTGGTITFQTESTPEPGSVALLGLGLAALAGFSRRRRRAT